MESTDDFELVKEFFIEWAEAHGAEISEEKVSAENRDIETDELPEELVEQAWFNAVNAKKDDVEFEIRGRDTLMTVDFDTPHVEGTVMVNGANVPKEIDGYLENNSHIRFTRIDETGISNLTWSF